jgi:hypothetical protein
MQHSKKVVLAKVTSERVADWWLGHLDNQWFRSLEKAVQDEWGVTPLHIREGGVRHSANLAPPFNINFSLFPLCRIWRKSLTVLQSTCLSDRAQ